MKPPIRGICSLCEGIYYNHGHNPAPLGPFENRCCDECNSTKVIPARLKCWIKPDPSKLRDEIMPFSEEFLGDNLSNQIIKDEVDQITGYKYNTLDVEGVKAFIEKILNYPSKSLELSQLDLCGFSQDDVWERAIDWLKDIIKKEAGSELI